MIDVLSDLLRLFRLRAHVFLHSRFYGSWAIDTSGERSATFHLVGRGTCWLHLPGKPVPAPLHKGDLVVFPHDAQHTISNSEIPPSPDIPRNQPGGEGELAGGAATSLICGYFLFDDHRWNPLLNDLPEIMIIRGEDTLNTALMDTLSRFMIFETENEPPGGELVIDKLSEVLFIHLIRSHIQSSQSSTGYIGALADPQIGKALQQFHASPGNSWSVELMAEVAGMSRSSFAEKFQKRVDMTPMQYVTCWRMQCAFEWFVTDGLSISRAAEKSGYLSEASFSKAFKKHFGFGPGEAKKKRKVSEE